MLKSELKLDKLDDKRFIDGLNDLPQNVKQVLIDNKRLIKKNYLLQAQIQEKNRIIAQLKEQIDATIMEDTKNRLQYIRLIENQVDVKTEGVTISIIKVKSEYIEKMIELQDFVNESLEQKGSLQESIKQLTARNEGLIVKIDTLKKYTIDVMEQKDYIIAELNKIISEESVRTGICMTCLKNMHQQERAAKIDQPRQKRKKGAVIVKNE